MPAAALSASSLAALEAQLRTAVADAPHTDVVEDAAQPMDDVQRLIAAEQSLARRDHFEALQREFNELISLSADEASGWKSRREARAASTLQAAWRRRGLAENDLKLTLSIEHRMYAIPIPFA